MHYYEAIKARALYSVLKPDTDYYVRRIYRWYSKTFHTPLEEVFDLPIEMILREYFEEYFEGLEEEDLDGQLEEMTETEDQRKERLAFEDFDSKSEHELLEMSKKQNVKLADKDAKVKSVAKPGPKPITNKLPDSIATFNQSLKEVTEAIKEEMKSDAPLLDEEIDMKFEDDTEFERLLNADAAGGSDIKKP
jgi:hypothetical protein